MTSSKRKHYEKYRDLAHRLSLPAIRSILPERNPEKLRDLIELDEHLNNIPLRKWDNLHPIISRWARENDEHFWSLCYTVCVAKWVATYDVAGIKPPK